MSFAEGSDGVVCPEGEKWKEFGDYCYFFPTGSQSSNFNQARYDCHEMGVGGWVPELVSIHTDSEREFVYGNVDDKQRPIWIGLSRGRAGEFCEPHPIVVMDRCLCLGTEFWA